MRRLRTLVMLLTSLAAPACVADGGASKPNAIILFADDLGYADIGPFGSKLNRTPHLDRMAQEGRKLTCFYAAPVCSPSRAAMMSGMSPHAAGSPTNNLPMKDEVVTFAEVLRRSPQLEGFRARGLDVGDPIPAVQPGRRIFTVKGTEAGLAVMSPDRARPGGRR